MHRTPLHWAAASGLAEIVTLLIGSLNREFYSNISKGSSEQGADASVQDQDLATPLHYACQVELLANFHLFWLQTMFIFATLYYAYS